MKSLYITAAIAGLSLGSGSAEAQTTQVGADQVRGVDLTRAGTILFRSSPDLPSTCAPGEALLKSTAPSGLNLYVCLTANNWVLQADPHTFTLAPSAGAVPVADGSGKLSPSWIDLSGYQSALGFTPLNRASNLSDIGSATAARSNLGLGAAALRSVQGGGGPLAAFAGGLTIANDCVKFDAAGNLADAGAPCGTGTTSGTANFSRSFTAQTTVTLAHNANTTAVLIQCFDGANNLLLPNAVTLTDANSATVGFSAPQTGKCVVNSSGGGGGGQGGSLSFSQVTGVAEVAQGGTGQTSKQAAFDALAPTSAKGDMLAFDGATNTRIGVGADGSCWTADSTQPAGVRWGSCSGLSAGAGLAQAGATLSIDVTTVPTFLTGAGSLTFAAIPNGACAARTFALTGAATADGVAAGWPSALETGLIGMIRVSAANTIEVRLCNFSGSTVTPAGGQTFRATIVRSF